MSNSLTNEVQTCVSEAKQTLHDTTQRVDALERSRTMPNRPSLGEDTPKPEKLLRKAVAPTETPMLGSYLKGVVTGNWSGYEKRDSDIPLSSTLGSGGYSLPLDISAEVIDFARAKSVCMDAGCRTILMSAGNFRLPRLASDPVGVWKPENLWMEPTTISFEGVDLKAHTLCAIVRCSIELFEDSAVINEIMVNSLTRALGLQLDQAILLGTGTNMPLGIRNTPGVTLVDAAAGAGAQVSRALISNASQIIWQANGVPNAVIMSPREYGILDRQVDSLTQPLRPFPSYDALTKHVTSSIPETLDSLASPATQTTSELFVGDFSQVAIGIRTNWQVEATRLGAGAFDHLQVAVRLYGRFDVAVLHPQMFVVVKNLSA